ncbi:two-component system response regulator GlrR [Natronospira proteinivora]|uniref:Two-component system response regulator GlrR n=1 Tax=Natronospira proteinivora TaxID=1807133 RepID=A0ABT1G6V9_9GAMM|nr:sigma-54 dependent transcriptional regulator [Natronospira proteinivora]MCP1727031.1 two-component system response regulator GlrR [Natronospira proteinivora]
MNVEAATERRHGARVLLVDDDPGLRRLLSLRLEGHGYQVDVAENAKAALGAVATRIPQVVVTDLRMEGMDGMALFRRLREELPTLPVIIITAYGTIPDAVAATREGAFGFLTKPVDSTELLDLVAEAAASGQEQTNHQPERHHGIVTRSREMATLLSDVSLVAQSDASVVIQGESGTGKEVLARAIHAASNRANHPFVAINCAAVPADLLESELFGHEKGAFTGADRARSGLFQEAEGGTLFLDEIGDMPLAFQAKLLRALQERKVRPVGGREERPVNVRVVSATHRDIAAAMVEGAFREDLYYRLNVVRLDLPPLRERPEDIPLLAEHFLAEIDAGRPAGQRVGSFSPEAVRALLAYSWPGNVRQLRNVVEQVCVLCRKGPVPTNLVQRALREGRDEMISLAQARDHFERDYIARTLRLTDGNVSEAARLAGRNRTEFYRLLKRHHLNPRGFKS